MRMLIIDDEEDICDMIAEIGTQRGLKVRTLSNPETVTTVLAEFKPDFIMLDLMMPGTDGVELLRLLAAHLKDVKLCLISGSDVRVLNSARRLGSAHGLDVVAALEKPINITVLKTLFDELVASRKGRVAAQDLAEAIALGQFKMYYQPVIEMKTRRIKGVEALSRWMHPQRGTLLPDQFLEQVVHEGLMQALTDIVVKAVTAQAASWHRSGEDFTVSMNMTASALLDLTLPDRLVDMCRQQELPTDRLILEVTETEAMRDVTRTMDVLLRMRLRNIGVSIDDFGTGHSSLRELQRMPFSELKIDKSFITDMAKDKDCAVIVGSIIDMGHGMGLKIIAEGIEDKEVWDLLLAKGCDYAQGFYMGKPMPASAFDLWLKTWREQDVT